MQTPNAAKKPTFPLPRGYFGNVRLSKQQHDYYREFCANQVQRGLLEEKLHERDDRRVDMRKWKPVRSQHQFQLFKRRDGGLHENDGKPSMLGVGQVEGTIEDLLYGAYDQTDEELRMTAGLVDVDFGDGIVLQNMEQGSAHDPYRYLGVKWILTPFPMPALMPDRDWVLLESSGISKDANGRRYGYHTLFTVDMAQCPEFPGVIRGTMWYTFIYRDTGRGLIDVHSQGYFDCRGDLLDPLTIIGSTQMFYGVFRYIKSAEAKKLTILALETLERKLIRGALSAQKPTIHAHSSCSICATQRSSMPFSSRRLRVCGVCDAIVCLSCRVKKNILVGRQRMLTKVSVCQRCIAHAKSMIVFPADEKYVISREMNTRTTRRRRSTTPRQAVLRAGSSMGRKPSVGTPRSTGQRSIPDDGSLPSSRNGGGASSSSGYTEDSYYYATTRERSARIEAAQERSTATRRTTEAASGERDSSFGQANYATTPRTHEPNGDPDEAEKTRAEQGALFERMMLLEASARRAHELTEASRVAMVANNVRV